MSDTASERGGTGDGEGADRENEPLLPESAPSDAFAALGSETRMGIVRSLFAAEREAGHPVTRSFSALYAASEEDTTAGFAYHLRQLPDTYLRKVDSAGREWPSSGDADEESEVGYRLTAAGRRVARVIAAGTLTESADRDPVVLDAPCPFCAEPDLHAAGDDTVLTVACEACDREVLALPFPPAGYRAHDDGALPAAVDSYYRGRVATMRDGTCPECGGVVDPVAELVDSNGPTNGSGEATTVDDGTDAPVARARMTCTACGYRLRCPVTLTVLDEPAVVAAFHVAGVDLSARPLWNVGSEWRERVVSTDPLAVRVWARVGGGGVACFVGRDLSVVYTDCVTPDDREDGRADVETDAPTTDEADADGEKVESDTGETGREGPEFGDPDSATA